MKKVLITGNSGYIGSHLTKLLEHDYQLSGLDIVDPQISIKNFFKQDIKFLGNNPYGVEFDAVIHLAALVNVNQSQQQPTNYYLTNLFGTLSVLNRIKTKNFILASTGAAEYSQSVYGISKRAAEDVVEEYAKSINLPYTIFRFYNVIGGNVVKPTNVDGLMHNLHKAIDTKVFTIHGNDYKETIDGTCVRDYVHVNEICTALKQAIEEPSNSIECLGHGIGHSVLDIVNKFKQVNSVEFEVKFGDRRDGDLPISVLSNVSRYMKQLYTFDELLKIS